MNRKDLKVENVQHYLYQNYFLFVYIWNRKLILGVVSVSCTYTPYTHTAQRVHNFENVANLTTKLEPEGLLTTRTTI